MTLNEALDLYRVMRKDPLVDPTEVIKLVSAAAGTDLAKKAKEAKE